MEAVDGGFNQVLAGGKGKNDGILPDVNVHLPPHPSTMPGSSQNTTHSTNQQKVYSSNPVSHTNQASKAVKFPSTNPQGQKQFLSDTQHIKSPNLYQKGKQIDTDSNMKSFKSPNVAPNSSKSVIVQKQYLKNQKQLHPTDLKRHPINSAGSQIVNNFTKSPIHSLSKQLNGEVIIN